MDFINELSSMFPDEPMTKVISQSKKSPELSSEARQLGNDLFRRPNHDITTHEKVLQHYSKALALAPNDSVELAQAYGNKSAILLHLGKFEDAAWGLRISAASNAYRVKLLSRKVECLVAMGKAEGKQEALQEAKRCFELLDDKDKEASEKLIARAEAAMASGKAELVRNLAETEHVRVRESKESKGICDTVRLIEDTKKGHHFVATTDIKPGELIFISKPNVMVANVSEFHSYCAHCLNVLWSSVPCENCIFSLYCSEECKNEAWSSYHSIECPTVQFLLAKDKQNYIIHAAMRSVIKAVKEFGSIQNLMDLKRQQDALPDNMKGFDNDGNFSWCSFKSLFKFFKVQMTKLNVLRNSNLMVSFGQYIIALARCTSFFGENSKFETKEDVENNQNLFFLTSLILEVACVAMAKGYKVKEHSTPCKKNNDQEFCCSVSPCCDRGFCINVARSFILISCNPNVRSVTIDGGKKLFYALQPIAKGEPLSDLIIDATFFEMQKSERCRIFEQRFTAKYSCNCIACENNWPAVLSPNGRNMTYGAYEDMVHIAVNGIKNRNIPGKFSLMIGDNVRYSQATVNDWKAIMSAAYKVYSQPSDVLCSMISILFLILHSLHGIKVLMPQKCRVVKYS